jgi:ferredoxin
MAFIQPDECVDCGACVQVCPVEAIYYQDDLPPQWAAYTAINAAFFAEVGSPGGAEALPKGTAPDPAEVTALPPRAAAD